jgi:hypothetical protein
MLVRTAVAALPVAHRQAVELREFEDCSYQEMAEIIALPNSGRSCPGSITPEIDSPATFARRSATRSSDAPHEALSQRKRKQRLARTPSLGTMALLCHDARSRHCARACTSLLLSKRVWCLVALGALCWPPTRSPAVRWAGDSSLPNLRPSLGSRSSTARRERDGRSLADYRISSIGPKKSPDPDHREG